MTMPMATSMAVLLRFGGQRSVAAAQECGDDGSPVEIREDVGQIHEK